MIIPIRAIPAPRLSYMGKYSDNAKRYYKYREALRLFNPNVDWENLRIRFGFSMPKSWPKSKKESMLYMPHRKTPDLDNLVKGFKDALLINDSHVWKYDRIDKMWDLEDFIYVRCIDDLKSN